MLAGREAAGKAFRLFTEASFNQLAATTLPEIQRVNLSTVALQLKALGFDDLPAFDFMDRPPMAALLRALETLYALGALDDSGMPYRLPDPFSPLVLVAQPAAACSALLMFGCHTLPCSSFLCLACPALFEQELHIPIQAVRTCMYVAETWRCVFAGILRISG